MKENVKLYQQLRMLKLKMEQLAGEEEQPAGLETLAAIATILEEDRPMETPKEHVRRSTRLRGSSSKKS